MDVESKDTILAAEANLQTVGTVLADRLTSNMDKLLGEATVRLDKLSTTKIGEVEDAVDHVLEQVYAHIAPILVEMQALRDELTAWRALVARLPLNWKQS